MGFIRSLSDKLKAKRRDLEQEAAKKAAKVVLERGAETARGAVDAAGKAIEAALFGPDEPASASPSQTSPAPIEDPAEVARVAEASRLARAREVALRAQARADAEAKVEAEIDAELAALKKKVGK